MVSVDGEQLIPQLFRGQPITDRKSTLVWPEQHDPSRSDWQVWSWALQPLLAGTKLLKPIDMESCRSHQQWLLYMDHSFYLLHSIDAVAWVKYRSTSRRNLLQNGLFSFNISTVAARPPPTTPLMLGSFLNLYPMTLQATRGHFLSTLVEGLPSASPFNVAAESLPSHPYYSFLFGNLTFTVSQKLQLTAAIQQGILLACCNGSYDPHSCTAAYRMVFGTTAGLILRSSGPCTGQASQLSPIHS
jgi:hypothetical protein